MVKRVNGRKWKCASCGHELSVKSSVHRHWKDQHHEGEPVAVPGSGAGAPAVPSLPSARRRRASRAVPHTSRRRSSRSTQSTSSGQHNPPAQIAPPVQPAPTLNWGLLPPPRQDNGSHFYQTRAPASTWRPAHLPPHQNSLLVQSTHPAQIFLQNIVALSGPGPSQNDHFSSRLPLAPQGVVSAQGDTSLQDLVPAQSPNRPEIRDLAQDFRALADAQVSFDSVDEEPLRSPLNHPSPGSPSSQSVGSDEADYRSQLRSSRSTRNQDHQAAMRNRPGAVDLDPTEGLPVTKWGQQSVTINQDPSTDPSGPINYPGSNALVTGSTEWNAQFNTPQYPFSERDLPSFFSQLPLLNQELVRRARAGNTNPTTSTWNNKTKSWNSGAEMEKRQNAIKSGQFGQNDTSVGPNQKAAPDSPAHDDEEEHDDKSDDEAEEEHGDDTVGPTIKRRKKFVPEERTFTVKRWTQVPTAIAEKTEERKFLADRRPGMPSLYGGTYQNQVFGSMGLDTNGYGFSTTNAGFDLGDGSGLGNAAGVVQPDEAGAAPVRRNMPPKRKKKKGGPGRKKANPGPTQQNDTMGGGAAGGVAGLDGTAGEHSRNDVTAGEGEGEGEGEGSDSGTEAEGSEEGEIDEGGHDGERPIEAVVSQTQPHDVAPVDPAPLATNGHATSETKVPSPAPAHEPEVAEPVPDAGSNQAQPLPDSEAIDTIMQDKPVEVAEPHTQPAPEGEVAPLIPPPPAPQVVEPDAAIAAIEPQLAVDTTTTETADLSSRPVEAVVLAPEPTSPDLLGGLEDELNKKMGEQAAE